MTDTIAKGRNEYGFRFMEVLTPEGGRVKVTEYEEQASITSGDIGGYTMTSPNGIGGSNYIRNLDDKENKIASIKRTVWLSPEAKTELTWFIKSIGVSN